MINIAMKWEILQNIDLHIGGAYFGRGCPVDYSLS
jgi:hypothetical protein